MNLLTVKNLNVQIERKLIIENLSFELAPGEKLRFLDPTARARRFCCEFCYDWCPTQVRSTGRPM